MPEPLTEPRQQKTVLVTGGEGLVGNAVREVTAKDVASDRAFDRAKSMASSMALSTAEGTNDEWKWVLVGRSAGDLTSLRETQQLFEMVKPTHVLHLAGRVGGLFANQQDNLGFYRDNTLMQDNVNQCCMQYGVQKLVSCLSTCIFPAEVTYPITEQDLHRGPPHSSNYGYAYAKRLVDIQNKLYNQAQKSCLFTSVIPTNVYGKHDNFNVHTGHVIAGLIHKCHLAQQANNDLIVAGSGKPVRQFMHSLDLARLLVWAVMSYEDPDPIILANPTEYTIAEVAGAIAEAMHFKGKISFDTAYSDGQFKKTVATHKLDQHLPDFEFISLHQGVKQTVQWFQDNLAVARK